MSLEIKSLELNPLIERHGRDPEHGGALTGREVISIFGLIWAVFPPNAGLSAMLLDQRVVATASDRTKLPLETATNTEQEARTRMGLSYVMVTCAKLRVLIALLVATLSALKVQT